MKSRFAEIKDTAIHKFLTLVSSNNQAAPVALLDGCTEEVLESTKRGRSLQFAAGRSMLGGGASARLEENYLFDTRRFATGAMTAGDYLFFSNAVGSPASNNGFAAGMTMSEVETNMDVPAQIAQGKDFVLTQVGLSFNSNAAVADIQTLLEAGALRFNKQGGQFSLRHGVARLWPGGVGVANGITNGQADIRAVRRLTVPRILRAKDTFNYSYHVPRSVSNLDGSTALTLTAPTLMTIWLWGAQRDAIPS